MSRASDLDDFHRWVLRRGRSRTTADNYRWQLRKCMACKRLTDRLLSRKLAPNSKRLCLASLRAWAHYRKDGDLLATLKDIRLPAAERVREKVPLSEDDLRRLVAAIEATPDLGDVERTALLLLCKRGIRVGGVVALRRDRILDALADRVLVFQTKRRQIRYGTRPIEAEIEALANVGGAWTYVADLICPSASADRRIEAARRRLWRLLRDVAASANIDPDEIHPHRLRRTYATMYLEEVGGDITKLKDHMQWSEIATAAKYVDHSRREELDGVAERMMARLHGGARRKPARRDRLPRGK